MGMGTRKYRLVNVVDERRSPIVRGRRDTHRFHTETCLEARAIRLSCHFIVDLKGKLWPCQAGHENARRCVRGMRGPNLAVPHLEHNIVHDLS